MEMTKPANPDPRTLLGQLRSQIRVRHYSLRTEETCVHWTRRYLRFHGHRHPRELGPEEMKAFLSALADGRGVAASTQNQALSALLFLYKEVLGMELPWLDGIKKAKRPRRLPVVLTREEARALLARMDGTHALMARLLHGTGMRLTECLQLRVKDVELTRREVVIREGKGGRDRVPVLPSTLVEPLRDHLARVRTLFDADRAASVPPVELPGAYGRKNPSAGLLSGNGCSRSAASPSIREAASGAATTCTTRPSPAPFPGPRGRPGSPSPSPRTCCGTASPRTSWRRATTSARCRSCWATRT